MVEDDDKDEDLNISSCSELTIQKDKEEDFDDEITNFIDRVSVHTRQNLDDLDSTFNPNLL